MTTSPILFVHIPKTAGTSLRRSVASALGSSELACDYGRDNPVTSPYVARHLYEKRDLGALREALATKKMIAGHFCVTKYLPLFPDAPIVTFLREPIDRVESEFNHFVTRHGYTESFAAFVTSPSMRNKQRFFTRPLEPWQFAVMGSAETYDRDLSRVRDLLGVDLSPTRENVRSSHGGQIVDPPMARMIVDHHAADVVLYHLWRHVGRIAVPETPRPKAFANAMRAPDGRIRGYAMALDSLEPLHVSVRVAGIDERRFVANAPRNDLVAQHMHLTGEVGFEIAAAEGPIELRVVETGQSIPIRSGSDVHMI